MFINKRSTREEKSNLLVTEGSDAVIAYNNKHRSNGSVHSGSSSPPYAPSPCSSEGKKEEVAVIPHEAGEGFTRSTGLSSEEAATLLLQWGRNELEEKSTPKWLVFLKQLWGPMPCMIWVAIIIEAAIRNWLDMGILLALQFINATLGWYETCKAADAVAALKASLTPHATVKRDGKWQNMDARDVVPGDLVLLAAGAAVPADCVVNEGCIEVDQSALTGESLPVTIREGQTVLMGSTCSRGEVEATVQDTGARTFFGKTATMIQSVQGLGNLQKVLYKVMVVLLVLSITLCGTAFIYLLAKGEAFHDALSFTVILLVASIPIAIEIVCTATLAIGSRNLSKFGAIVTRLVAIEEMAGMNILCSDKTGTLTLNTMVIQDDCPVYAEGHDRQSVLTAAALAAKWMEPAKDALDTMVLGAVDMASLQGWQMLHHMPFDPTVKRTESTVRSPEGETITVTKGAPHVVLAMVDNEGGLHDKVQRKVAELGGRGIRCLAVAQCKGTPGSSRWQMLGIMTFLDPPRPDTKETIERALAYGVDVKMITGDHSLIAKETARMLGMGTNIRTADGLPTYDVREKLPRDLHQRFGNMIVESDGFAQVFPEHKFMIVETLRQGGFGVGMTGDGVNDAPALKRADVGIAVSGATDAARAASDIILTEPGLSVIVEAIIIARQIFQRVYNFFCYRIAATLQLLTFFFISVFAFKPNEYPMNPIDIANGVEEQSYFQLPVILLMLITVLNDGTLISVAYDRVLPSQRPEKWNLKVLFFTSTVLGMIACGSSLLLLWGALDSNNPDGWFAAWGLPGLQYGQVITLIYLKVSISDFLTLFSARTRGLFFMIRPSWILLTAALFSLGLSTLLACVWPDTTVHGIPTIGLTRGDYKLWWLWTWLYCLFWWLVQDILKALTYVIIYRFNVLGASSSRYVPMREAHAFQDPEHANLAGLEAGRSEARLLQMKAADAVVELTEGRPPQVLNDNDVKVDMEAVKVAAQKTNGAVFDHDAAKAVAASEQVVQAVQRLQRDIAERDTLGPLLPPEPLQAVQAAAHDLQDRATATTMADPTMSRSSFSNDVNQHGDWDGRPDTARPQTAVLSFRPASSSGHDLHGLVSTSLSGTPSAMNHMYSVPLGEVEQPWSDTGVRT